MSLNGGQTETIIFKSNQQTITKHLNFRVSGHKIHPTNTVKYLDVYLNDFLTWDTHLTVLLPQLNWAVGLLAKICDYTPKFLLKSICYSFFIFHLIYAWPIRGKTKTNLFTKIEKLHDKALQIIGFLPKGNPMNDIYENSKILDLQDYISLQNALLVKDCFDEQLPKPLKQIHNMNIQLTLPEKSVCLLATFVLIRMVKTQLNTNLRNYGMSYNVIWISNYWTKAKPKQKILLLNIS